LKSYLINFSIVIHNIFQNYRFNKSMSRPGALVEYKEPSSGTQHRHNFVNRYLADDDLRKPSKEVAQAIQNATKQELNRIVGAKTDTAHSGAVANTKAGEAQFIKYTPQQQGDGHNSGASQRIIKMHEVQVDPLEPPKFKHKRVPKGAGSPPKTIMHSPPRKLTVKDQQDWKIPPCISNWKNAKGYTIPLEMRLSADGRTLQQHTINEKFAKLANSFYVVERQARKEIEERNRIQKSMAYKDYLKQEDKMREAASLARAEKNKIMDRTVEGAERTEDARRPAPDLTEEEEEAKRERDTFRYINKREQERDRRLDVARNKKSKAARDAERDVSEKIALGQAQPTASKESMYDQRLFNQTSGLESGFGDEDEYNAFDKPLFQDKTAASIYNIKEFNDDVDESEPTGDNKKNDLEKMLTRQPNKGFEGADKKASRSKPVEFERQNDDTFNLDMFVNDGRRK
jgi:SNW domain-containing protein 1